MLPINGAGGSIRGSSRGPTSSSKAFASTARRPFLRWALALGLLAPDIAPDAMSAAECYACVMLNVPAETEQLARLVAAKSGTTPEEVVREAVEQRARVAGVVLEPPKRPIDLARIDAITRRSASRPLLDDRSVKDILDDAWGEPSA